jgi:phosphodiesterase/alkaline phosphatase D-like protein
MRGWWRALVGILVSFLLSIALVAQVQITRTPTIEMADSTSATIVWSTSQPANSRVWYSEDAEDLTEIAEGTDKTTEHRVRIEGLQPNTTYFFQIESVHRSTSTIEGNSPILSFRTVAPGQQSIRNQKASVAQTAHFWR